MAKKANETTSQITESTTEEEEVYLNYDFHDNVINITVNDGGKVVFQQGRPKTNPPPPGGG